MTRFGAAIRAVRHRSDLACALAAIGLTSAAALIVLEIWRADLNVPFVYRDDANFNLMLIKGILENGWYLENPGLGAPLGQELYDYPAASGDHLNLFVFKLLGLVSGEPGAVMNAFFLLTFPLTALTAFVVMRRFGTSAGSALVCASLYALLPYHFLRGETHLSLSAYYTVPLAAYLVLAMLTGESLFTRRKGTRGWLSFASRRTLATLAICVVVPLASGSFYYAGFAVVLFGTATLLRFAVTGRPSVLATGGLVLATILAVSALQVLPTLAYHREHGGNPAVGQRQPFESEYYSLRLTQLILPIGSHRIEAFARVTQTYEGWSPSTGVPVTEAALATLGTIGSLGFLGLLGVALASAVGGKRRRPAPLLRAAGTATVVALLIATMGGFSSLFGLLYPQLRAWNRLSIFIAFFAFLAVGVALDRARRRLSLLRVGRQLFAGLIAAVFVFGVLDQTSEAFVPAYKETASRYESDRAFVRRIERQLPADAAVFQLPYAAFPEFVPPPPGRTVVYDMLQPYLHSERLRWSFGAMQGRPADWAARLADDSIGDVVPIVSAIGFDAIYVDRLGYPDDAAADVVEGKLAAIVDQRPLRSRDGRILVFDLRRYNERLRNRISAEELASLRARALPGEP